MYTDEPESSNQFAIGSLNRSLLEQNAAKTKTNKKDAVGGRQFYRLTVSNRYHVFDVTCIALWVNNGFFRSKNKHKCLAI